MKKEERIKRNKQIVIEYLDGKKRSEIASRYKLSRGRVREIINRVLKEGSFPENFVYQDLVDLEDIRLSNKSRRDIVDNSGVNYHSYRKYVEYIKSGKTVNDPNLVKAMFAKIAVSMAKTYEQNIKEVLNLINSIDNRS